MPVEILTRDDLKPLEDRMKEFSKLIKYLSDKVAPQEVVVLWKKDILKMLGKSNAYWEKNMDMLPVTKANNGHYYCYKHELEEWLKEGNL